MNSVIEQCMRCTIHESANISEWEKILSIVELKINSLPNKSIGLSPFYLNYGYASILPIQLIKGDEQIRTESIGSFIQRVTSD